MNAVGRQRMGTLEKKVAKQRKKQEKVEQHKQQQKQKVGFDFDAPSASAFSSPHERTQIRAIRKNRSIDLCKLSNN
ncbi:integrase family protein [Trichinella spiralis]|uniref:integrase family protein n=1 Tax=Trichinella spiralis TaxID=6334 RepID=UPI0001EFBFF5|nr:integrase family protein [Trichinella spiralis]